MVTEINESIARKVLCVVDAGLVSGMGEPIPGKMCVEAAVNYAMGMPHGDQPPCVAPALRRLKIAINDKTWSSDESRAKGLRRLAIAQLGSAGALEEKEFAKRVSTLAIQTCVPSALRSAAALAKGSHKAALLKAADTCETAPTRDNAIEARAVARAAAYAAADAADAAYAAADAADAAYAAYAYAAYAGAARDERLAAFCEGVVQILIAMKAPGCQWLWLTEAA